MVKTLVYADIFDYPLTEEELYSRLIAVSSKQSAVSGEWEKIKHVEEKDRYYFLKGRKELVALRKRRMERSRGKWQIAQRTARILRYIPTLKLIGVSGGLACHNADDEDDIDFFLITARGKLWMTRLFVTGVLECLGLRRRPGDTDVKDTICVNMIVDERHLTLPKEEQDVFGAYEVALMKPVWQRDGIHSRFLTANSWIKKWLPNWKSPSSRWSSESRWNSLTPDGIVTSDVHRDRDNLLLRFVPSVIERVSKTIQLRYMNKRRTTEIIENGRIRFHPQDVRRWVMEKYKKRCDEFLTSIL